MVAALDDTPMDTVSNRAPWTVRRLASHALDHQLLGRRRATVLDFEDDEAVR